MNSIIHQCSHLHNNEIYYKMRDKEVYENIFHFIDYMVNLIKPKKLLYMAVDGVAPRAKMNQQRSRRFRTAKEAIEKEQKAIEDGSFLEDKERFDSNCITPSTEFMANLHKQFQYFITKKVSTDDLWKNLKVIYSGHEAPGEGEHKIMDFIRFSKSQSNYDPLTRHCLYGLDADLIMLGIVTHEPFFSLLREEFKFTKNRPEDINFQLLHLNILRDYLEIEFEEIKFKNPELFNIESIFDDWILM